MRQVDELNRQIENLLKKQEADAAKTQEALKAANDKLPGLQAEMDRATAAADPLRYSEAKAALQKAEDAAEMYTKRIEQLQKEPLVAEDTYKKASQTVFDALEADNAEKRKRLREILEELLKMKSDALENTEAVNGALTRWQAEVYRNADIDSNTLASRAKLAAKDYRIPHFITYIMNHEFTKELLK